MELGIYSFVETNPDTSGAYAERSAERMRHLLEEIELADQVGLDIYGIGEHHRPDFVASAPAVILAAAAARTKRIRLTSAVTVISSDDPVRVFQEFATVDLISGGRAEIIAGRGSFIESFPLFGYDLDDYDTLFAEKLALLLELRTKEIVSTKGGHRAAIHNRGVYPRPLQEKLPVWIGVGGTPASAMRAGGLGLPMALAIIGGEPDRFVPFVQLFRQALMRAGHDPKTVPVSINSHGFIADTMEEAVEAALPPYLDAMGRIGKERGWPPPSREQFDFERSPNGAMFLGAPQDIVDKILYEHSLFGHQRMMIQFTVGSIPHDKVMRCIELFGTQVAPAVRKALGV
jgi:probable LLM family oxidoreductase